MLMMATLISRSQAECFPLDGECTKLIHFSGSLKARRFEKSADVCPIVRNGARSPQGSVNPSSIVLKLSLLRHRHTVPLKSPATKSTS